MDEPCLPLRGDAREHAHRVRVHAVRRCLVLLGVVDGGISGGIDDDVRGVTPDRGFHACKVRKVHLLPAERFQIMNRSKRSPQLPADLAVFAYEKNSWHPGIPKSAYHNEG
jgi:hypothetical protein